MSENDPIKKYTQALAELTEQPKVMLMANALSLFGICAHLQIGLRNSDADETVKDNVRTFAKGIQQTLANMSPLVGQMLETGWNEDLDKGIQELVDECHLDNTLKYLKEFHQYLISGSATTEGVLSRLSRLEEAAHLIIDFKGHKSSERWEECVSTLKVVAALCRERYNVVLAGFEEILEQINEE
ncbi:MAG: hypothetical protein F6J93_19870 [Oscillatoria sp. SIO1A7]|nr:hypothetical protein [Oscillatoria sp. SIO1A7]